MLDADRSMRELVDRINEASRHYYQGGEPIMSDAQWDILYAGLQTMEKNTGVVLPDSPSRRVGGEPLTAFRQHRHLSPLWSMDKAQTTDQLRQWFARTRAALRTRPELPMPTFVVEHKYDGLTINLTYKDGVLFHAATRGNGIVGEEILPQAMTVRDIPLAIPYQGLLEIHGECIMRLSDFARYNATAAEPLKNARNAAAGALRNLDPRATASRRLSAFFYEVGYIDNPPFDNQQGMMAFIADNGFPASPTLALGQDEEAIIKTLVTLEESRESLDFLVDGAVIKINDRATRAALGYTDKFPRWAIAYKFEAQENITLLEAVTWEPGRTGKLTPLGHVEPVDFSGVTIRRATLNNWGDIQRKGLMLGSHVWIRRSNDVIPEIMGRVSDDVQGTPIPKPEICPACGSTLLEIGAHLFCPNSQGCKPQVVARLTHFAGRDAMDITTFSDKTAELVFDVLGIRQADELYALDHGALLRLPGFKGKKADNLLDALRGSKACTLDAFLFAIGIPGIGRGTARDIALHFGTLERVRSATIGELSDVSGVGPVVAQSTVDFFAERENLALVDRLLAAGVRPHDMVVSEKFGALNGLTVAVTGTLPTLSRQEAEELIRRHGGIAASSINRKTSYLLCGENAGSKLAKAHSLAIPVLTQAEFLAML